MAEVKEKVICPWCKEEMRPYPHQGYYWFQCKCGARSPSLWHSTEERAREKALSYTADVVPKSEVERLKAELVRVQARHPFAMTLFELEACEKHAAIEAVKEVWRELRSKCDAPHWCVWLSEIDDYFEKKTGVKTEDIAELKKKYT